MGDRSFSEFFRKLALGMDALFVLKKEGVLVPLLARPNPTGQGYELIAGHRRKAASKWAGVDKVPVILLLGNFGGVDDGDTQQV